MGKSYLVVLLMTLAVAGTYWYKSTASICPAPLSYRIGSIDSSFGLSPEEALIHIKNAEALWEEETNRDLFVYDETADFTFEFIFDERQQEANYEASLREDLDAQRSKNDEVLKTVESLRADFQSLSAAYKTRSADYEARLSEYNSEVNKYNDRGGAPADVFERLADERTALNKESAALSRTADELNALAEKINELGEKGNMLVDSYNREVNQYNSKFGFSQEFTQGDYQGNHIRIYKFSSDTELETVLAHEFGHALGVGHVEGESSLMYYLLEDTDEPPILSPDDLIAYYAVCGTEETIEQTMRRIIREFLIKIK